MTTTWEQHWSKLDDGSGRYVINTKIPYSSLNQCFSRVPQEKFVEYVTTSDDYKHNLHRSLV